MGDCIVTCLLFGLSLRILTSTFCGRTVLSLKMSCRACMCISPSKLSKCIPRMTIVIEPSKCVGSFFVLKSSAGERFSHSASISKRGFAGLASIIPDIRNADRSSFSNSSIPRTASLRMIFAVSIINKPASDA